MGASSIWSFHLPSSSRENPILVGPEDESILNEDLSKDKDDTSEDLALSGFGLDWIPSIINEQVLAFGQERYFVHPSIKLHVPEKSDD